MLFFFFLLLRRFSLSYLSAEISDQLSAQLLFPCRNLYFDHFFGKYAAVVLPTTKSLVFHRKRTNADLVVALVFSFFFCVRCILYIIFHSIFGEIICLKSSYLFPWGEKRGKHPALTLNLHHLLLLMQTHETLFCHRNGHFFSLGFLCQLELCEGLTLPGHGGDWLRKTEKAAASLPSCLFPLCFVMCCGSSPEDTYLTTFKKYYHMGKSLCF